MRDWYPPFATLHIGIIPKVISLKLFLDSRLAGLSGMLHLHRLLLVCFHDFYSSELLYVYDFKYTFLTDLVSGKDSKLDKMCQLNYLLFSDPSLGLLLREPF